MAKRLYIGNLPYTVTEAQLQQLFAEAGEVESVNLITDKFSGRAKDFAFVEMKTEEGAAEAVKKLNGYSLDNRTIVVNKARPREERSDRGGSGSGSYSRGGGGYGRGGDSRRSY